MEYLLNRPQLLNVENLFTKWSG